MTYLATSDPAPIVELRDEITMPIVSDGLTLEGRLVAPAKTKRIVVLTHPHPMHGGSMHNAVVLALAKVASEHGAATVRFDYRGVGKSEGRYDNGRGEARDVIAAIRTAKERLGDLPVTVAGYSFGAWTALQAACARVPGAKVDRLVLVAPAASLFDFRSIGDDWERPTAIILGDHDEICSREQAKRIARHLDASLTFIADEGHFFYRGRRRMAERIASFMVGEGVLLGASLPA